MPSISFFFLFFSLFPLFSYSLFSYFVSLTQHFSHLWYFFSFFIYLIASTRICFSIFILVSLLRPASSSPFFFSVFLFSDFVLFAFTNSPSLTYLFFIFLFLNSYPPLAYHQTHTPHNHTPPITQLANSPHQSSCTASPLLIIFYYSFLATSCCQLPHFSGWSHLSI